LDESSKLFAAVSASAASDALPVDSSSNLPQVSDPAEADDEHAVRLRAPEIVPLLVELRWRST
jgi:hypothetical protein